MLEAVRQLIMQENCLPASEHELLVLLIERDILQADCRSDNLALFQAHFLIMNALYQLRLKFRKEAVFELSVSPLRVELKPVGSSPQGRLPSTQVDYLEDYYLDWSNLRAASSESVQQLLDGFWERFLCHDQLQDALNVLQLQSPVTWATVKSRYRELAMRMHPDRGGDKQGFARLRSAYESLKLYMGGK